MAKDKKSEKSTEKKASKRKVSAAEVESAKITKGNFLDTAAIASDNALDQPQATKQILLSPIAKPLSDAKLKKRTFKVVKKAAKGKQLRRGVKEVVKALRRDNKGLCIIAGDISPIDVIAHLPIMCEDRDIPYLFVPSKEELGLAAQTKRPTSCLLIMRDAAKGLTGEDLTEYHETYDDVFKKIKAVQPMY